MLALVSQIQLDEYGMLEIKMKFSPTAASRSSELFSHFFLSPLAEEEDAIEEGGPSVSAFDN